MNSRKQIHVKLFCNQKVQGFLNSWTLNNKSTWNLFCNKKKVQGFLDSELWNPNPHETFLPSKSPGVSLYLNSKRQIHVEPFCNQKSRGFLIFEFWKTSPREIFRQSKSPGVFSSHFYCMESTSPSGYLYCWCSRILICKQKTWHVYHQILQLLMRRKDIHSISIQFAMSYFSMFRIVFSV